MLPFRTEAAGAALNVLLRNGPSQVASQKSHPAGNTVVLGQVKAIPNATLVNAYMQIGSTLNVPLASSPASPNRRVGDFCHISDFNGWAKDNWVWVRGNHYYDVLVDGVNSK